MAARAHSVRHQDAEETIVLVRRHLHQEAMVASADQDADLDAAVHHDFREPSQALVRDFHLSASEGAEA
jgi:hypothetical protein